MPNCPIEKDGAYCAKVNMKVCREFCQICNGEPEKHRRPKLSDLRKLFEKPLTAEEINDRDLVSVVIPTIKGDIQYLQRTIDSLHNNAAGPIEVFACLDGCNCYVENAVLLQSDYRIGQRAIHNLAAKNANGKYLFFIDAHCTMSNGWDARMKASCRPNDLVCCLFDYLDDDFRARGKDISFVILDNLRKTRYLRRWKPYERRDLEEETMGISGCAWMIRKSLFEKLGGSDESYGPYGAIGSEWAHKIWFNGGRCIIRTDVVCGHLFRNEAPFEIIKSDINKVYEKLREKYPDISWLRKKFSAALRIPVPILRA